jgi:lipopolysaccharide/colanic/teichoic acid biosynthesis glycosyltransferase
MAASGWARSDGGVEIVRRAIKRALDVVVASGALIVLLPVLLVITAAIRFGDRGAALFRQERVGRGERTFTMYKFRTMVVDQDAVLDRSAFAAREATGLLTKMVDDPRVTRVGRLLRRTSLDELPQLLNVVKGEMSLVGPRPLIPLMLDPFPDLRRERSRVRPGLTGPWQVKNRAICDSALAMADEDLDYVQRHSVSRDLQILAATLPALLRGTGM